MALLYTEIPKDHIRLLHLGPSNGKAVVEVTLETVPIHTDVEYEALSYVWGKRVKKKAMRCNRILVDATKNLVEAMEHLRYPDRPRVLWVDALCINQKDNDEKSAQVMMMGDIYSRAIRTVIWLGPAEYTSDIALAFIRKTFDDLIQSPGIMRDLLEGIDNDEQRGSVALLPQREWWTRIWIIQELCLSKEAIVVCGNSLVPWEAMTFAVAELGNNDDVSSDSDEGDSVERSLAEISRFRSLSTTRAGLTAFDVRPRLHDALTSFRWFRSTNPLNKVYAVLSITDSPGVFPDYNVGPKQCFEEVARRIITQSTDLDMLDQVVPSYPLTSRDTP
ncbi:heterokaryon incompatibility protein-domain-containing protein, partial [Lasiosphaeris hirsuta]